MSKSLDEKLAAFGEGVLRKGTSVPKIEKIPSGIISLDTILSGGWPRRRVVELYGPPGSGKSTIATMAMAEAQKQGLACLYIDLERTYDPAYAGLLGVDSEKVLAPTFDSGEEAIDGVEFLISNWKDISGNLDLPKELGVVVIDSVAALLPQAEVDSDIGEAHVGLLGRLMSRVSRKFTPLLDRANVCMMYINQLRATINSAPFAPKTTTTGGNAIQYYASLRVDVRRIGQIKSGDDVVGCAVRIMLNKDKVAGNEAKSCEVEMYHGKGISKIADVIAISEERGLITKRGAWYHWGDRKFQGRDGLKKHLFDNPTELEALTQEVLK